MLPVPIIPIFILSFIPFSLQGEFTIQGQELRPQETHSQVGHNGQSLGHEKASAK
jgi:hypothetical protein